MGLCTLEPGRVKFSYLLDRMVVLRTIVYYVSRRTMRVIARRGTMLAGDRSRDQAETKPRRIRGAISPASIVASLIISRIVYRILIDACAGQMIISTTIIFLMRFALGNSTSQNNFPSTFLKKLC